MAKIRKLQIIPQWITALVSAVLVFLLLPATVFSAEQLSEDSFSQTSEADTDDVFADIQAVLNNSGSDLSAFDLDLFDLDAISGIQIGIPLIPSKSSKRSEVLAMQMLGLSSGFTAQNFQDLFDSAGFHVLEQIHFDKDIRDASHTCAFTIGKGQVMKGLIPKKALLVSIRGTNGGEWFSNFDFCPSHNENTLFAENFLYAAEDVFLTLKPYLDAEDSSVILVCGHSRGAACANLLGMLLDDYIGTDNVYVYTFATPATIRSSLYETAESSENNPENESSDPVSGKYQNIFNYINPCDMVPELPLAGWNYMRAGIDILLPAKDMVIQDTINRYADIMYDLAPTITSYYNDRHSLTASGTDENGLTSFELMLIVCDKLIELSNALMEGNTDDLNSTSEFGDTLSDTISENSDLKPLEEMFREISTDHFDLGIKILMQHLPNVYFELINEFGMEN